MTVEFVRQRFWVDSDVGTVFWHDHALGRITWGAWRVRHDDHRAGRIDLPRSEDRETDPERADGGHPDRGAGGVWRQRQLP